MIGGRREGDVRFVRYVYPAKAVLLIALPHNHSGLLDHLANSVILRDVCGLVSIHQEYSKFAGVCILCALMNSCSVLHKSSAFLSNLLAFDPIAFLFDQVS